jgi:hypothetical protein
LLTVPPNRLLKNPVPLPKTTTSGGSCSDDHLHVVVSTIVSAFFSSLLRTTCRACFVAQRLGSFAGRRKSKGTVPSTAMTLSGVRRGAEAGSVCRHYKGLLVTC